ncbi:uncharacterized protein N7482_009768 [Penicillium canariense]|uniref:Uncharacterized protein n=1 Tax=Penicillium canariense TaxID=189055 RepID=A0A9W9LGL7_9EURO|nr:uncharacterized protein N7482_009768 [Penicillium canariense]KAJ5153290.1 hypothetical protein N7482_009768 [Penicillium canariense]
MRSAQSLRAICSLLILSAGSAASGDADAAIENANHIFNVIHDSMRQWGSSLHHNGVSFFLATVPAGTQLYHGTSKSTPVNGTEWLAFEPEHAMVFARPHRGPPPRQPDEGDDDENDRGHRDELRRRQPHGPGNGPPGPLPHVEAVDENDSGYLHIYATTKDLRLVYIDGMSAAKTTKGTLDSQDVLLFNNTLDDSPKEGQRGPMGESERAKKACEMAENEWDGHIDGVLRMEAGFEIILCAFERGLTPLRITQVKSDSRARGQGGRTNDRHAGPREDDGKRKGPPHGGPGHGSSRWMRAVSARYGGIGGNRVSINYENFVTAFSHDLDLFPEDSPLPRLGHLPSSELDAVRKELTARILAQDATGSPRNWQAITDMIVTRYADELSYLVSGNFTDAKSLHDHIEILLSPFIDYSARNTSLETERCATQFLPLETQDSQLLAARAVHSVAHSVCSTLLAAWGEEELDSAVRTIQALIDHLDWTTWKECRGCEVNEICVVPIWPEGTVSDYENPQCREASNPYEGDGESYWGGMHH